MFRYWILATLFMGTLAYGNAESPGKDAARPSVTFNPAEIDTARADSLELPTSLQPVPGEALLHHTAGYAKIMCSAIFITGLDPEDAAKNVGGFTAPFDQRAAVVRTDIDYEAESVTLTLASGVQRVARRYKSQGCITHPLNGQGISFKPSLVLPKTPDPKTTPWPMGDLILAQRKPHFDSDKLQEAVNIAMRPEGRTLGFLVMYRGEIIAEEYGEGVDMFTPFESWSMGKSLIGILMGVLIQQGAYELWQPAPIPEWQGGGDPRAQIRIGDLMRMSSGVRIRSPADPDYDSALGYPDHLYLYTGPDAFKWAATRPLQWPPNTVGRYRNTDPVLTSYLIRLAVESRGDNYHAFPQRSLFDKLGIRHIVMETDSEGNFLTQGYVFGTSRDWARLGNLYLQDGFSQGERLLPEGYVDYAFTRAPAWLADDIPLYGGAFIWRDNLGNFGSDYGTFAGAGGQGTLIFPEHELVIVRHGKYSGQLVGVENLMKAVRLIIESIQN